MITAPVRVRPRQFQAESNGEDTVTSEGPGCFTFALTRRNPRDCGAVCQDMVVFRPGTAQIELCRLTSRPVLPKSSPMVPGQRRASALTEMMRAKAFGEGSDLEVKKTIKARWSIPLGSGAEQSAVTLDSAGETTSSIVLGPRSVHNFYSNPSLADHAVLRTPRFIRTAFTLVSYREPSISPAKSNFTPLDQSTTFHRCPSWTSKRGLDGLPTALK